MYLYRVPYCRLMGPVGICPVLHCESDSRVDPVALQARVRIIRQARPKSSEHEVITNIAKGS